MSEEKKMGLESPQKCRGRDSSASPIRSGGRGRSRQKIGGGREVTLEKPGGGTDQNLGGMAWEKVHALAISLKNEELTLESDDEEGRDEEGRRGTYRGVAKYAMPPEIQMRPEFVGSKEGSSGKVVPLLANYFSFRKATSWALYQHRVDFSPVEESLQRRKGLVKAQKETLGPYIFDGTLIYTLHNLAENGPLTLSSVRKTDNKVIEMEIQFTLKLEPEDGMYIQFFNLVIRKALYAMDLELMGRNFFDRKAAIKVPNHRLELWPGYVTSVRRHENGTLLCTEITHKVLRLDNVLTVILALKNSRDYKRAVTEEITGTIVMTHYNRKTYRVDDIAWDMSPKDTFQRKGEPETYAHYYQSRYEVNITDMDQPLLAVRPRDRDFHEEKTPTMVYLVPETCQLTGLSDNMRANFSLMKDLSRHLHMPPSEKVSGLMAFIKRLVQTPENIEELRRWDLDIAPELTQVKGRVLTREGIVFAGPKPPEVTNEKGDWTMAFRSRQMLSTVHLDRWVIVVPQRDVQNVDNLVKTMSNVAKPLNMIIRPPLEIVKMVDMKASAYSTAVEKLVRQHSGNLQLLFVILPNNKLDVYSAVKKRLSVDFGIPSQCFLAKNMSAKGLMSIATKVVIQMNAKLGGEPWSVTLPLKKAMFLGFDVYHGTKGSKGAAIGALVATTSANFASYFSTISYHRSQDELSKNLNMDLGKALSAYEKKNGELPERLILFRDGVGEGDLNYVFQQELEQMKVSLGDTYGNKGLGLPKFTFFVVSKRINTRLFSGEGRPDNPLPGTVVDSIITLPHRFDFYLVATAARQGTVSPTSYSILHDTQGLDSDKLQRIVYKMCHMYYNWSGTVAVPAPCQYAHKLAFLAGTSLGAAPHSNLHHVLHFL